MFKETPIPQPPPHWLVGNLPDFDPSQRMASQIRLHALSGPIFKADLAGRQFVYLGSRELVHVVCDQEKFEKLVGGPLNEVRALGGSGLFTARNNERDWSFAHKMLMPVMGPLAIEKMWPQMMDITSQMLMRWTHLPEKEEIEPVDQFTRLTLDTIALCAFNYRFNSFYTSEMHPFVTNALDALLECGKRSLRTSIENRVRVWSQQKFDEKIQYCWRIADEIVAERKANPRGINDLLNVMLKAEDPDTGERFRDALIRFEMMTFLLAGPDTTSGLLNFAFLEMLKNPRTLQAAQAEIDRVLGDGPLLPKHAQKLKYVEAVLRETLRLWPTAPAFLLGSKSKEDVFIGEDRYRIRPTDCVVVDLPTFQRDPKVWRDDAEDFRPERMLNGGWQSLPPDSWKPFGTGVRSCIGRAFAWQEALMAIALILQRFQVEMVELDYTMKIRQTLTIKPTDWHMKVRLRPGKSLYRGIIPQTPAQDSQALVNGDHKPVTDSLAPLAVFYGSNQGTCKTFAENLQSLAPSKGFRATVSMLDAAIEQLPTDRPVVFVIPSYEGHPPDNGKQFLAWLEANKNDKAKLKEVMYCLFGVGNSDWVTTFHRVAKLIDTLVNDMGGSRIFDMVLGDVAQDIFGAFDTFSEQLWSTAMKVAGKGAENPSATEQTKVETTLGRPEVLDEKEVTLGTVRRHIQLADAAIGPEKRLMEIDLPRDMTYRGGDYLVVLSTNSNGDVKRVLKRFQMPIDALVRVSGTRKTFLAGEHPENVFSLIAAYVEIGTPISRKQLRALAATTKDVQQTAELERLSAEETFQSEVLSKRASVIDMLERFPACELSFAAYLDMLQAMKPRQYSIA